MGAGMYQWPAALAGDPAQGYQGSVQTIYRFLRGLRKKRRVIWKPEVPQAPLQDFSARRAVWLFARAPDSLEEKEQATLTAICQASETAQTTYQLVQEFRHLLHRREGEKLEAWLAKSAASQICELQSFVKARRAGQSGRCSGADSSSEQWGGRGKSEQTQTDQANGIWQSWIPEARVSGFSMLSKNSWKGCSQRHSLCPSEARLLGFPEELATNRAGEQRHISVRKRFHSISVT